MHLKLIVLGLGTWIVVNGLSGPNGMIPVANAAASDADSQYFTIESIETHEVISTEDEVPTPTPTVSIDSPLNSNSQTLSNLTIAGIDIGTIINIGKEIWNIVEANKPVTNITTSSANAIPKGITDWQTLAGWQTPQARTFQTTFTNGFGMDVITFQYRLTYTAGGTYRGLGKYLTHVTVTPSDVYVAWGYTLNAQVTIPSITNAGTPKSPIAAADILVQWNVDTVIGHTQQSAEYYVRGDGEFDTLQ